MDGNDILVANYFLNLCTLIFSTTMFFLVTKENTIFRILYLICAIAALSLLLILTYILVTGAWI